MKTRDSAEVDDLLGVVMSNAELKAELALAELVRDLAHAKEERDKRFAAIVRFVQHREAKGPARDMREQIRRDYKLCRLLVDLEDQSEIVAMTEFVYDLKKKPSRRRCSPKTVGSLI